MLWITKLTEYKFQESDFGQTFARNAKNYRKFEETLPILQKQYKQAEGDAKQTLADNIETVKAEIKALNKKLCSNIEKLKKNPEAVQQSRERMKAFHGKPAATSSNPEPAATPEPVKTDPPEPVKTNEPAPTPEPAKPEPAKTSKPEPTKTAAKKEDPKKKNSGLKTGLIVLGTVLLAAIGIKIAMKKR